MAAGAAGSAETELRKREAYISRAARPWLHGFSAGILAAPFLQQRSRMKPDKRTDYLTRDSIMNLLSDDEVARVSTAETAAKLADGDEYIDLERLAQGVQRAPGTNMPMGGVLPRSAVDEKTWGKILKQL